MGFGRDVLGRDQIYPAASQVEKSPRLKFLDPVMPPRWPRPNLQHQAMPKVGSVPGF